MARYSNPFIQYHDGNSATLPGATLDFFQPGTTTRKKTYSDPSLKEAVKNPNPVVADAAGVMPDIWLDGLYKVVLKNAAGVIQAEGTKDPIGESTSGEWQPWVNDVIYNIPDIVKGSNDRFYRSLNDANQGNDPTTSPVNWEEIEFERIYNANVTYALGDRSIAFDGMLYFSLVGSNLNNDPVSQTVATNWRAADQIRSADAGGTVDAITATYIPAVSVLRDGLWLRVRSAGANTITAPTFSPNGLPAGDIVKNGGQALVAGNIGAAGHELILVHNEASGVWELINPAIVSAPTIPRGYIDGLITANGADADHDIDISVGECTDSTNTVLLSLPSVITKQIDATWAEGTNQGGLPSALTLLPNTTYHEFLIEKPDKTADAGWDTATNATNLLADATGYTLFRLIMSHDTDGASNIIQIDQDGDEVIFKLPLIDFDVTNPGGSAVAYTLSTPLGIKTIALATYELDDTSPAGVISAIIRSLDQDDIIPTSTLPDLSTEPGSENDRIYKPTRTNLLSQIRIRLGGSNTGVSIAGITHGFIHPRGKE